MKFFFSILLLFCLSYSYSQGNPSWAGFGIETNFMTASMIRHTIKFEGKAVPQNGRALEINLFKQTWGQKDWQIRRNYPQLGVGVIYIDYNAEIYGQVIGIYPNIDLPIIKRKKVEWNVKLSMGIGYISRHFQRQTPSNYENIAIGSHLNNVSHFASMLRWRINNRWDLQTGVNFTHTSNAGFRTPNLGINVWGVHLGTRYFPVTGKPEKSIREVATLSDKWFFNGRISIAFREMGSADGPLFPVYVGSIYASRRYASKDLIYGGFDWQYHTGVYTFMKTIEDEVGTEWLSSSKVSVFLGHEIMIGKVGIVTQIGYYLKKDYMKGSSLYQKIGGKYYLLHRDKGLIKSCYFSALLKTHLSNADFFEMGIGIGL